MSEATIIEAIEVIIFTFTIIFCIKNYFINLIEINNSLKNILLITLCVILLISSSVCIGFAIDLDCVLINLATEQYQFSPELLALFRHQRHQLEQLLRLLGILQGTSLLIFTILFLNIKKEIKIFRANFKSRWDWDKITK